MPSRSIARVLPFNGLSVVAELPPAFLAPALYRPLSPFTSQCSKFSTSPVSSRDRSRWRGVSAIHRTGPKRKLIASDYPLPRPAPARVQEKRVENPNHGLWGFFGPNREAIPTPEEDYAVGRAWSIQELRQKSWDDLHRLWWVCAKERNRIVTAKYERERLKAGYGEYEADNREKLVRVTQNGIKHVLRERWHAWSEARQLYDEGYRPEWKPKEESVMEESQDPMSNEVDTADIKVTPANAPAARGA